MILATRYGGDVAVRSATWPDRTRPSRTSSIGNSGVPVTLDNAVGLPAVGRAIRLVSGLVASLTVNVCEGKGAAKRNRGDTPVGRLLGNPYAGMSPYDWLWDIAASLEATENWIGLKLKDKRGVVREILPVPANVWSGYVGLDGQKTFDVMQPDGRVARFHTDQVLHIRGQTVAGGTFGVSRIQQHADPLGSQLAAQRFEGSYMRNRGRPDLAVIFPAGITREQAAPWREEWEALYAGPDNAGKVVPLGGGATIQTIPLSMRDAQFVESKQLNAEQIGMMMDIDPVVLGVNNDVSTDKQAALDFFLRVQFIPRLKRIEGGFRGDLDLFPVGTPMYPEFELPDAIFADAATRSQIQHEQIQDGRRLVDEIRAEEGMPPLPALPADWTKAPGMVPQITPVGGAPNPTVTANEPPPADRGITVPSIELRVDQDMQPLAEANASTLRAVAATMQDLTGQIGGLLERFSASDERREQRDADRAVRESAATIARRQLEAEVAQAQAEAFRAVSQPNIVVNVEPTPVAVENVVNVPVQPVQLTLVDETTTGDLEVTFDRNANGTLKSAYVTER